MYLYLVRHGEAKSEFEDSKRPLSEEGRRDVHKVASAIKDFRPRMIFHSEKLRARETAEILGRALGAKTAETAGLSPGDSPDRWADELLGHCDDVMLVGHLPHIEKLASLLLSGFAEGGHFEMGTATVVCLRRENVRWALQWMVTPRILG